MDFTQDWFTQNIPGMKSVIDLIPEKKTFLEIGSFEGRSACWFLQEVMDPDGSLWCIDNFGSSLQSSAFDFVAVKSRFEENTNKAKKANQNVFLIEDTSLVGLSMLLFKNKKFDFIYIDGSHTSPDTLTDACMAFPMLKKGGAMVFDDYLWEMHTGPIRSPKAAIDTFVNMFSEQCRLVLNGYQVGVVKTI